MKGLSVIFTILLLVAANQLALHLKRAGVVPSSPANSPGASNLLSCTGASFFGSQATQRTTDSLE